MSRTAHLHQVTKDGSGTLYSPQPLAVRYIPHSVEFNLREIFGISPWETSVSVTPIRAFYSVGGVVKVWYIEYPYYVPVDGQAHTFELLTYINFIEGRPLDTSIKLEVEDNNQTEVSWIGFDMTAEVIPRGMGQTITDLEELFNNDKHSDYSAKAFKAVDDFFSLSNPYPSCQTDEEVLRYSIEFSKYLPSTAHKKAFPFITVVDNY